jgi:hypothetical protein
MTVHDGWHGISEWHGQTGVAVQQQDFAASDVPAAHTGCGLPIPSTNTAMRI